jgi:hypothetical protein
VRPGVSAPPSRRFPPNTFRWTLPGVTIVPLGEDLLFRKKTKKFSDFVSAFQIVLRFQ